MSQFVKNVLQLQFGPVFFYCQNKHIHGGIILTFHYIYFFLPKLFCVFIVESEEREFSLKWLYTAALSLGL